MVRKQSVLQPILMYTISDIYYDKPWAETSQNVAGDIRNRYRNGEGESFLFFLVAFTFDVNVIHYSLAVITLLMLDRIHKVI